ncbi:hypothetical protein J4E80_010409 [Alternaria sp. BMP 0032]|nr:hypothetical protein J4E80_010409 [Alternaria sp. BMP 0032]
MFGGGIFLPDPSTYDPLEILLNTHDQSERDELVEKWRDNKLSELNFVGVVSALLAGVLTSTGSWPNILTTGRPTPWYVRTSWYCGIIITMLSIISAADQTVAIVFTAVAALTIIMFFVGQISLYSPIRE